MPDIEYHWAMTLKLTENEARAIYKALGNMSNAAYDNAEIASAGSELHTEFGKYLDH